VGGTNACGPNGCDNGCNDPCFDPCACKTFHLSGGGGLRGGRLLGGRGIGGSNDPCCNNNCNSCAVPSTRKVWRVRCVTEQVPCTVNVTRCVTEQVAYTVCRKEHYNEVRNVPYTVRRMVT